MASDMTSRELYIRLLTYVRPYWKALVVAMVATGLSSLAEPVLPAMMKRILDDGFSSAAGPWDWLIYPLAIMGVFLLRASFGFIGEYLMSWVSNRAAAGNVFAHDQAPHALLQRQSFRAPDVAYRL